MDSNRKFIYFNGLFCDKDVQVIRCGSTNAANNVIKKMKIEGDEILMHIGINDLETKDPNVVVNELSNIARLLKDKCTTLYVSKITPRNDNISNKVNLANELITKNLEVENIQVIEHPKITIDRQKTFKQEMVKRTFIRCRRVMCRFCQQYSGTWK